MVAGTAGTPMVLALMFRREPTPNGSLPFVNYAVA